MIYLTNFVVFVHFLYEEEGNLSEDPNFFSTLEPLGTLKSVKLPEILNGN
jgi:hypothetical protein